MPELTYLDHHAAAPPAPEATAAMAAARQAAWANPSSVHAAGRESRKWLEGARERVAAAIGARASDVALVGGGTEACNLGVLGLARRAESTEQSPDGQHIVTTEIEHPAVARPIEALERCGMRVTRLALPNGAPFGTDQLAAALSQDTCLVALGWVNHETGTRLPLSAYSELCATRGIPLFVDATQAVGKLPVDVRDLGVDALAMASHKLGGPAGAGALWVRRDRQLSPVLLGGGQERGRRAGTPDVVAQVGFGAACSQVAARLLAQPRLAALQVRLEAGLQGLGALVNGDPSQRVATVVNVSFKGLRGDELVAALDVEGVACASGAACSSGLTEPSPVITAMYPQDPARARGALRFSFGPETRDADVDRALEKMALVLNRARAAGAS
ncbi:MAG: cysteine desulfurase family protein [Myxococcales bacterium]|nr:cysteine desulfurase family protein [Myxococcales bacterium]